MAKTLKRTYVLNDEVLRRLQELSRQDDRSHSAQIRYLIDREFERRQIGIVLTDKSGRYRASP